MEQQKHDNDYFSFFSSHENIILKPESNFKGLRTFLTHLPIDYYILLQEGYDSQQMETPQDSDLETTNYIYCENIPLIKMKEKKHFKTSSLFQTIMLEDLY